MPRLITCLVVMQVLRVVGVYRGGGLQTCRLGSLGREALKPTLGSSQFSLFICVLCFSPSFYFLGPYNLPWCAAVIFICK